MEFTYESYEKLLNKFLNKGYSICTYSNWMEKERSVILRHDVDNSLQKAMMFSEIEKDICGGGATYFVLLSTNFYNIFSKESRKLLEQIQKNGGIIGLHFDETQYRVSSLNDLIEYINREKNILSDVAMCKIEAISMHRPSKEFLASDMQLPDVINTYSKVFFEQMKYLSDSRRNWREDVEEIVEQGNINRFHILTHPFWYFEKEEKTLHRTLKDAILDASLEYYDNLKDNFKDLELEIDRKEIERIVKR